MIPNIRTQYRNTYVVEIDCNEFFYYSYETCVGYKNFKHNLRIRLNKFFSRTTSKHIGKMSIGDFVPVDEYEFKFLIEKCQTI